MENILYNSLLGLITLNVLYLLIKSIIPNSKVLIEYNDYGIKIKTIKETKEIPFNKITSLEVRTHGSWASGRLSIKTYDKRYMIYPLKNVNQIKTLFDKIKILNK